MQEIEKKKGKKPQEAPKFSKKQEEQLAAQKQKESEIRERLRAVIISILRLFFFLRHSNILPLIFLFFFHLCISYMLGILEFII